MISNTHPRNVFKFSPRCGSKEFNSKNHGHSFHCEGCHFTYFINNSAAVACLIFDSEGKLLVTRRALDPAKGMLDLPGGFVDPLERVEDTVVREIKEELGVNITNAEFMVSFPNEYIYSGFTVFTVDLAFICSVDNLSAIVPEDDVADVEFIFPEEIRMEQLCSQSMFNIISYYINNYK